MGAGWGDGVSGVVRRWWLSLLQTTVHYRCLLTFDCLLTASEDGTSWRETIKREKEPWSDHGQGLKEKEESWRETLGGSEEVAGDYLFKREKRAPAVARAYLQVLFAQLSRETLSRIREELKSKNRLSAGHQGKEEVAMIFFWRTVNSIVLKSIDWPVDLSGSWSRCYQRWSSLIIFSYLLTTFFDPLEAIMMIVNELLVFVVLTLFSLFAW